MVVEAPGPLTSLPSPKSGIKVYYCPPPPLTPSAAPRKYYTSIKLSGVNSIPV